MTGLLFTPQLWLPKAAGGYVGPGDVVAGASMFHGLRAYTAASIGSNVIRLKRSSDNTFKTFVSIAGGGINLSDAFFDASTSFWVDTLYDQTGNGNDVTGSGSSNPGPFFLRTGGPSGLPAIELFSSDAESLLKSSGATNVGAQPNTSTLVFNSVGSGANASIYTLSDTTGSNTAYHSIGVDSTAGNFYLYAGSVFNTTFSNNTWYSAQGLFNGASNSVISLNNALTSAGNVGTQPGGTGQLIIGNGYNATGTPYNGYFQEGAFWHGDKSASFSALTSNQRTYWGF